MATQIFSSSYAPMSVFRKKKPEEQRYFSKVDWSQYQSKPAQAVQTPPNSTPQPSVMPQSITRKNGGASGSWTVDQQTPFQKMVSNKQKQQQTAPPPATQTDITGINPLIAKAREIAQRQAGFYSEQADTQAKQMEEQQGIRQKYADERVSKLEALRDAAIGRIKETIPSQDQATNEYKAQVEDQYGRQMKEQSQAQREEQQGIQDLFAGLGTIDSGAFQTQAMKSRERLTANQSATITARTNELNAADRDLKQYKLQVQELISGEVQKFDDALLQIAENLEVGSAEYNAAVQQVYAQAQEAILGLEAGLSEKELAYEEKAQALQQEILLEQIKKGTTNETANQNGGKALQMINSLIGGNYRAISGGFRPGNLPILRRILGGGQESAQWEGLKNLLALAGRGQLKGSGAVSDFEAKMLEKAAMAGLDPTKQSEEQFLAGLQQLKQDLEAQGAVDNRMQPTSPTGGNTFQYGNYTVSY